MTFAPTPWTAEHDVVSGPEVIDSNGGRVCKIWNMSIVNRVVTAVNSHDDMLEALEGALVILAIVQAELPHRISMNVIEEIEAVIQRAKS